MELCQEMSNEKIPSIMHSNKRKIKYKAKMSYKYSVKIFAMLGGRKYRFIIQTKKKIKST